jgi:RNA polymerase sigma-70 factor (ECF subfamily)
MEAVLLKGKQMYDGYEQFWYSYLSTTGLFTPIAQLLFPSELKYIKAMAILHRWNDDPSERVICHLIPRCEVSNLPQHIDAAVVNAYSILGDYAEAVDITATVLLRIEQASGEPRDFKSYLMVSVKNEAIRRIRWRKRHEQLSAETFGEALGLVTFNTPEQDLIRKELCDHLRTVIDTLPKTQRQLIYLHFYDELTYKEIAELKGLSTGAVKASIRRALLRLMPKVVSVIVQ